MNRLEAEQRVKDSIKETLTNLLIELTVPLEGANSGTHELGPFQLWRGRAALFLAEFFSEQLTEFWRKTEVQPQTLSQVIGEARRQLDNLRDTVETAEFKANIRGAVLQETNQDIRSTYRVTPTQKKLLAVLVGLDKVGMLELPIINLGYLENGARFPISLRSGYQIELTYYLPQVKWEDLQILHEADLLSQRINSKGRDLYSLVQAAADAVNSGFTLPEYVAVKRSLSGSPFGFRETDWIFIEEQRRQANIVRVTLGYQFESKYYNSEKLVQNLKIALDGAVEKYNSEHPETQVALDFQPLSAGYGEHLFNEIARRIMSADIAFFETSDANPNVMIEMGVALTSGADVFPIKSSEAKKPPSDISGQTWVDYEDDGNRFVDSKFEQKLLEHMTRVIARKQIL